MTALWRAARNKVLGIVFLAVLLVMLGTLVAKFRQSFDSNPRVTLVVPTAGNQLNANADVKVRGLIVGRVADQRTEGGKATLSLSIPSKDLAKIPSNVQARILPKTLFGEKYVDLVLPASSSGQTLRDGDVIEQDRSADALEVERVLNDLFPLLRAVKPAQLNEALTGLSQALEGRGDRLGNNLVQFQAYLAGLEPHLPVIQQDLSGLADFADSLDNSSGDLLRVLRNSAKTGKTITAKEDALRDFLQGTQGFAGTATDVLTRDGDRLIQVNRTGRPGLEELAKGHERLVPGVRGLDALLDKLVNPKTGALSQGPYLNLKLFPVKSQGAYTVADCPRYPGADGPNCATSASTGSSTSSTGATPQGGEIDSAQEQALLDQLLGPVLGLPPGGLPDVAGLLYGSLMRGTVVSAE